MLAAVLILVGGAILISGELLGVFSHSQTITGWVEWLRKRTRVGPISIGLTAVLLGLLWLMYHFISS